MVKKRKQAATKTIYSVHPGVAMVQKWIADLPVKTGRSLEQWIAYIRENGPDDEKARRIWLKEKHGLGTNTAWWLAEYRLRPSRTSMTRCKTGYKRRTSAMGNNPFV